MISSSIIRRDWRVRVLYMVFVGCIASIAFLATSCTLVETCSPKYREYCIGSDCICGIACTRQSSCEQEDDVCAAYTYTPQHGVCVEAAYARKHKLYSLGNVAGAPCSQAEHCRSALCYKPSGQDEGFCTEDCGNDYTCNFGGECSENAYDVPGTRITTNLCLAFCEENSDCHELATCDRLAKVCVPRAGSY